MSEFQHPEAKKAEITELFSKIDEADDVLYSTTAPEEREGLAGDEISKIEAIRATATGVIENSYARLYELQENDHEAILGLIDKFLTHRDKGYEEIAEELGFST